MELMKKIVRIIKIYFYIMMIAGSFFSILFFVGIVAQQGIGCILRYSQSDFPAGKAGEYAKDAVTTSIASGGATGFVILADGAYSNSTYQVNTTNPATITASIETTRSYGQWFKSSIKVEEGDNLNLSINGAVSLCRSLTQEWAPYPLINGVDKNELPGFSNRECEDGYNLSDNIDNPSRKSCPTHNREINSTDNSEFSKFVISGRNWRWFNILEAYPGDDIEIRVADPKYNLSDVRVVDIYNTTYTANCNKCIWCFPICNGYEMNDDNIPQFAPEGSRELNAIHSSGKWRLYGDDLYVRLSNNLNTITDIPNENSNAINISSSNLYPKLEENIGKSLPIQPFYNKQTYGNYDIIFKNNNLNITDTSYFQLRFRERYIVDFSDNSGGYTLLVKHKKCVRRSGNYDNNHGFNERGKVLVKIAPSSDNLNDTAYNGEAVNWNLAKSGNFWELKSAPESGYLWFKINNDPNDYQYSKGMYTVSPLKVEKKVNNSNSANFLEKALQYSVFLFTSNIIETGKSMFSSMICYKESDQKNCKPLFTYIKALILLYFLFNVIGFLMGVIQLNQYELVIRVLKIGIVAGLINGKTFEFFNTYVFDMVINLTTLLISSVVNQDSGQPFNLFSYITDFIRYSIFNYNSFIKYLTLMIIFPLGPIIFIITMLANGILIIATFKAIMTFVMAQIAIALLIGLAPIFITFILFETTKQYFFNWINAMIKYILEPLIMFIGIIVLAEMLIVYLDKIIGFSVCVKCALYVKLPFLPDSLALFCIPWFAPWGVDMNQGVAGYSPVSIYDVVILYILCQTLYQYVHLAGHISSQLSEIVGMPSATSAGGQAYNSMKDWLLENGKPKKAGGKSQGTYLGQGMNFIRDKLGINTLNDNIEKKAEERKHNEKLSNKERNESYGVTDYLKDVLKEKSTKSSSQDLAGVSSGSSPVSSKATGSPADSNKFTPSKDKALNQSGIVDKRDFKGLDDLAKQKAAKEIKLKPVKDLGKRDKPKN